MKVGIYCNGYGPSADPRFIMTSAREAERCGFSAMWMGEHVVLFEAYPETNYPYGKFPLADPRIHILDPIIMATWIAGATTTLHVGTGILILPQRNPLVLAKELMTLDQLSGGRINLGIGVGWCKEEFTALGVPWEARGKRTDEYIQAMRALWRDDVSTFHGDTVNFDRAFMHPKPVRGSVPILIGGESEAALRRVARYGDGWYATSAATVEHGPEMLERVKAMVRAENRNPDDLRYSVNITTRATADDLKRYRDAGFTEFNLTMVGELPLDDAGIAKAMADLGKRFVDIAAKL